MALLLVGPPVPDRAVRHAGLVGLGTDIADPRARLQKIIASSTEAKDHMHDMSLVAMQDFLLAVWAITLLTQKLSVNSAVFGQSQKRPPTARGGGSPDATMMMQAASPSTHSDDSSLIAKTQEAPEVNLTQH